jgi:hypothetical protein
MKGRIRGFFIPAGRERGAEEVYTLLPPPSLARTTFQNVSLVSDVKMSRRAESNGRKDNHKNKKMGMEFRNVTVPMAHVPTGWYSVKAQCLAMHSRWASESSPR